MGMKNSDFKKTRIILQLVANRLIKFLFYVKDLYPNLVKFLL